MSLIIFEKYMTSIINSLVNNQKLFVRKCHTKNIAKSNGKLAIVNSIFDPIEPRINLSSSDRFQHIWHKSGCHSDCMALTVKHRDRVWSYDAKWMVKMSIYRWTCDNSTHSLQKSDRRGTVQYKSDLNKPIELQEKHPIENLQGIFKLDTETLNKEKLNK